MSPVYYRHLTRRELSRLRRAERRRLRYQRYLERKRKREARRAARLRRRRQRYPGKNAKKIRIPRISFPSFRVRNRFEEAPDRELPSYGTIGYLPETQYTWQAFAFSGRSVPAYAATSMTEISHDAKHGGPPYRDGGPFFVQRTENQTWNLTPSMEVFTAGRQGRYSGRFGLLYVPSLPWSYNSYAGVSNIFDPQQTDIPDLSDIGATGWNRFKPGKPAVSLGQAIAEARDVPKMLRKTSKVFSDLWKHQGGTAYRLPRNYADHWLNYQFGWLPFLKDLEDFHKTTKNISSHLNRIRRDNGKWVKRGGVVHSDSRSDEIASDLGCLHTPYLGSNFYDLSKNGHTGSYRAYIVQSVKEWFTARFRYYIPDCGTYLWKGRALANLYGMKPNAALIYELTPWSWFADWFGNIGDNIANLDHGWAENLVATQCYVMSTIESVVVVESTAHFLDPGPHTYQWTLESTRKVRYPGGPFGFGLKPGNLSSRQASILGSLGIRRL